MFDAVRILFHRPDAGAMRRLLERHANDTTGVVLRLAWCEGLTRDEIAALTWEQVDFAASVLRLKDREVPLEEGTAECLRAWRERYGGVCPCVAVSEKRRDRLAPQSLSRLARFALDEEGQSEVRLQDLRFDFVRRQLEAHDWPYVLRISGLSVTTYRAGLAQLRDADAPTDPPPKDDEGDEFKLWKVMQAEGGSPAGLALRLSHQAGLMSGEIVALSRDALDLDAGVAHLASRGDAARLLGVSAGMAYGRLAALAEEGVLVRVNAKYYPAGRVVPPERQGEAIRRLIADNGPAYCQEVAELLHIGKRPAARILKRMVAAGDLVLLRRTKRYALPGAEASAAEG